MTTPTPLRLESTREETVTAVPAWAGSVLSLALRVLTQRILLWLVTAGTGCVWLWTVSDPTPPRLVAAAAFSVLVLWPYIWLEMKKGE